MNVFDWIEKKRPKGFYLPCMRMTLDSLESALSPNRWFRDWARKRYPRPEGKAPEWASEVYQVGSVLVVVVLISVTLASRDLAVSYGSALRCMALVVAAWRVLEILLFVLYWTISDRPIHSSQRSLIGLVVNVLEVSAFTSVIKASLDPAVSLPGILADIGAGAATIVTFSLGEPQGRVDAVLAYCRLAIGAFLVLVVVSSVVGGIVRRSLDDKA